MHNELNDLLIDKILSEHQKDERLSVVLKRLNIEPPKGSNWVKELHELGILECFGSPDYLKITPFGNEVKAAGGWLAYNNAKNKAAIEQQEERELDRAIKEHTLRDLKWNIFQIKYWWVFMIASALCGTIISELFRWILK